MNCWQVLKKEECSRRWNFNIVVGVEIFAWGWKGHRIGYELSDVGRLAFSFDESPVFTIVARVIQVFEFIEFFGLNCILNGRKPLQVFMVGPLVDSLVGGVMRSFDCE